MVLCGVAVDVAGPQQKFTNEIIDVAVLRSNTRKLAMGIIV
jgi:hypothetical protein